MLQANIKKKMEKGTWQTQPEEHTTPDLGVVSSSPTIGHKDYLNK